MVVLWENREEKRERGKDGKKFGIDRFSTRSRPPLYNRRTPQPPTSSDTFQKNAHKKQILVRKLVDLKSQLDDARSLAAAAEDARRAAEAQLEEVREERDNARASLAAHVAELVERGEECARLRSAVEELTRALGGEEEEEGERRRGGGKGGGKGGRGGKNGGGGSGGEASGSGGDDDAGGLPSAPRGDMRAAARDARVARDLSSLEAEKLAAEMISAAEEESRGAGGGGDDFSSLM